MAIKVRDAYAIMDKFLDDYPVGQTLSYRLRDTPEDLYGEKGKIFSSSFKGGYVPEEVHDGDRIFPGRVDLALGNMDNAADMLDTLRHEVLGHFGSNTLKPYENGG